jgi:hypothetical protein
MKSGKNNNEQPSITQPLLQELHDRRALDCAKQNPMIGSAQLQPANLYQDTGNGFNVNFTFPQR